jgi:hypothetical protein
MAIIGSGTYTFPFSGYDFLLQASQALGDSRSVQGVAEALDKRITPLLKIGLEQRYESDPGSYRKRYGQISVMEFMVAGVDKQGPSAYQFRYYAATPAEFRNDTTKFTNTKGQLRPLPVPSDYPIHPAEFWRVTAKPGKEVDAQIADKIVKNIDGVIALGIPGISDPITTGVIDKGGFHFLNQGKCDDK